MTVADDIGHCSFDYHDFPADQVVPPDLSISRNVGGLKLHHLQRRLSTLAGDYSCFTQVPKTTLSTRLGGCADARLSSTK